MVFSIVSLVFLLGCFAPLAISVVDMNDCYDSYDAQSHITYLFLQMLVLFLSCVTTLILSALSAIYKPGQAAVRGRKGNVYRL